MEKYDTLKANPQGFLTEVLDFLEAEPFDFPNDILIAKPNKSNYKDEIPSFLKWYLATEWLPTVRVFHQTIDLDLHSALLREG
jgi:hypothetical protein